MFVANPVLGRISDTLGRRPVLLLSLGVGAVAHLWFAVSNDIMQMFAARTSADSRKWLIESVKLPLSRQQ